MRNETRVRDEREALGDLRRQLFALQQENKRLRNIIAGLAARVAAQSELLARRAEKKETA